MKIYNKFHGDIDIKIIGKELRLIAKNEKDNFKVLTGYGSTCGFSKSKNGVLRALFKMKKEGIIKGFLPGEVKYQLLNSSSNYYEDKLKYFNSIKNDPDFGNEGVIFVFLK